MEYQKIPRAQLKFDARAAMREHRPSVYLVTLVFLIISFILEILAAKLQFPGLRLDEIGAMYYNEALAKRAFAAMMENRSAGASILSLAIAVMDAYLSAGFLFFALNVARRSEAGVGTLFDVFGYFFRFLWLEILTGLFILLWSLLLVIPGIVAAYRYSMAAFIFFDDPDKGALACIRESKAMTSGYKGQLFVLDLSFIGWAILSAIPFVSLFTLPYTAITKANYYRLLSGRAFEAPPQDNPYEEPWSR